MSQRFSLYEALTVDQNIRFFGGIYGLDRRAARRAPPRSCSRWPASTAARRRCARDLAGGWRQRLALGCAILHEPPIVFLDEPTGGVDPLSRRQFWRSIDRPVAAGRDRARHDALSRRGRALPSHRDHPRRQARGARHDRRAEAGLRRPADRRGAAPRRRSRRCARSTRCRRSRRPASSAPPCTRCCSDAALTPTALVERVCEPSGVAVDVASTPVEPSLEDVFLDVVEQRGSA